MTDPEADLRRRLAEVQERLACYERIAAMTIGTLAVLSAVLLGAVIVVLLER